MKYRIINILLIIVIVLAILWSYGYSKDTKFITKKFLKCNELYQMSQETFDEVVKVKNDSIQVLLKIINKVEIEKK
jgi:hypothetical protein